MLASRMIFIFVFTSIMGGEFVVEGRKLLRLEEGAVCKGGSDPWICKLSTNCSTLKKAKENRYLPDVCSYLGTQSVYCCPPENYFLRSELPRTTPTPKSTAELKADEMCAAYSKYVYRNMTVISPDGPKNMSFNDCSIETLIVGGVEARPKEFPHMALIGYELSKGKFEWICGGSLISPKFVLTAAHCILENSSSTLQYWVRLGDLDTSSETDDSEPENIKVIKKIIHPEYNTTVFYHDIALFELEKEAKLSTYVRPICLHTSKKIESEKLVASGWGITERGRRSNKLQKVILPPVSHQVCWKEYGGKHQDLIPKGILDDSMLCAGAVKGKDTCQGDSGGPLQKTNEKPFCTYSQVGVVSFGKSCALDFPSIFTRVSHYVPWIVGIVWP